MSNMYERTFVYSREQMQQIKKNEAALGNTHPKVGSVVVNGVAKDFTEILPPGRTSRFADARTIITGDMRAIKYTDPNF